MTCGIYCLSFEDTDKVYIGQSVNIEKRYIEHKRALVGGTHYNYKLTNEYSTNPSINCNILEIAIAQELDPLEISYIKEFNSVTNGFNIIAGGTGAGRGCYNTNSKFSREVILDAFNRLCIGELPVNISKALDMSITNIRQIAKGTHHTWLQEEFPNRFVAMRGIVAPRLGQGKKYTCEDRNLTIQDPRGNVFQVTNMGQFARDHSLDSSALTKLFKGKYLTHKGWKIPVEEK